MSGTSKNESQGQTAFLNGQVYIVMINHFTWLAEESRTWAGLYSIELTVYWQIWKDVSRDNKLSLVDLVFFFSWKQQVRDCCHTPRTELTLKSAVKYTQDKTTAKGWFCSCDLFFHRSPSFTSIRCSWSPLTDQSVMGLHLLNWYHQTVWISTPMKALDEKLFDSYVLPLNK